MSDKPRTDSMRGFHDLDTAVDAEFSEQLERELNAANAQIKRLKKAGDRLLTVMRGEEETAYCEWVGLAYDAEQNWLKAKEDEP